MVCPFSCALMGFIQMPGAASGALPLKKHAHTTSVIFHLSDIVFSFLFKPLLQLPHSRLFPGPKLAL
jgi:hypothetical protein